MNLGQPDIRGGETRLGVDGPAERFAGQGHFLIAKATTEPVKMGIPLQIWFQGRGIYGPLLRQWCALLSRERRLDLPGDVTGYISFQQEHVAQVALIAISPKVFVCRAVNELRVNPHAIAGALDRSFYDPIRMQVTRDFTE